MSTQNQKPTAPEPIRDKEDVANLVDVLDKRPKEFGGPQGPEPTRYGDWERKGRCIDF